MTTKCRICSNKRRRGSSECNDIHFNEACYVLGCQELALDPGGMCPRHDWVHTYEPLKAGEEFIHQFETQEEWEAAHKKQLDTRYKTTQTVNAEIISDSKGE